MAVVSAKAMESIKRKMAVGFEADYIPIFGVDGYWIGGGNAAEIAAWNMARPLQRPDDMRLSVVKATAKKNHHGMSLCSSEIRNDMSSRVPA